MYELKLVRHTYKTDCTLGRLKCPDGEAYHTLEPPVVGDVVCIPKGRYRMSIFKSPKFRSEVLLLHDVPGRSAIEIHKGNYPKDTRGCILVACFYSERLQILQYSEVAMKQLMDKVKAAHYSGHELWIKID